jgi:hypothetical protein
MKRKRINISVSEAQYQQLQELQKAYGFKNLCELTRALLNIVTQYSEAAYSRHGSKPVVTGDEIIDMFNDLGEWENTPGNVKPLNRNYGKG